MTGDVQVQWADGLGVDLPSSLAPLIAERSELWSRWDRAGRLADGLERRAGRVVNGRSAETVPHAPLSASGDLIDELVAVDAAVVADLLAAESARARRRANDRAQAGLGERTRALVRSALALMAMVVTLVAVGVIR
ncbi:MAG: hypothetical protein M3137_11440 [Actinomycetota bacterium]|nr:hypothetical protein [Actinomycetota bacterium]